MIQTARIINFQSHSDSTLEFHKGVNCVIGSSDSGKSAIIRALKWVFQNRPMGDAFRSHWGGDTIVEIVTEGGFITTREKGKENIYRIWEEHPDGLNKTFKAFGNDVPEEILEHLNMDETCVQNQLDSPFLISNSPGEVSAYFNKIAHLDQIDTSLKTIQGQIRTLTSTVQFTENQLQDLQKESQKYEYLERFEIDLEQLERDRSSRIALYSNWQTLDNGITQWEDIAENIEGHQELLDIEPKIDALLLMQNTRDALGTDCSDIEYGINMLNDYAEAEERHQSQLEIEDKVDVILEMLASRATLQGQVDSANIVITESDKTDSQISEITNELVDMEETFLQLMQGTCVLCGQEISDK